MAVAALRADGAVSRREILERAMLRSAVYAYADAFKQSELEDPLERRMEAMAFALSRVRQKEREYVELEVEQFRSLSELELEAVQLVAEGLTYKQIAERLGKATSTVRTHLHNVYEKLGMSDRVALGAAFVRAKAGLYEDG